MLAHLSRPINAVGQRLPNGWGDAARQFLLVFLAYQGYQVVRGLTDAQAAVAFANAERIIDVEQALGTFFEPSFQSLVLGSAFLIDLANFLYMNSHFVVTTAFLVWLYLFRNPNFYFVRNMFMVAMLLALVGYGLYPTAPPRLIPEAGFVDTIAQFTAVQQDSQAVNFLVNQYAAVPSMHIGFASMVGGTGVALARHPATRALWALYPLLVFAVIVATANHFWIDAAAGAVVALASYLVAARILARVRPEAWSFRQAPGEATA